MQARIDIHGNTVAGKKFQIIVRVNTPDTAQRLGHELVNRDRVDFLTGLALRPDAVRRNRPQQGVPKYFVPDSSGYYWTKQSRVFFDDRELKVLDIKHPGAALMPRNLAELWPWWERVRGARSPFQHPRKAT